MISFNALYNRCLDLGPRDRSVATSPVNYSTLFKGLINETQHRVISVFAWPFLEKTANLTSVASQESYEMPIDTKNNQVVAVRFEVSSSVIYRPKPVHSVDFWEYLQSLNTAASDVSQYFYIQDEKLFLYPKPSSASKTIRVRFRKIVRDMTQDDYTTGSILTTTNGGTGVVGTATPNWVGGLSPEATLHLRITKTASDSAKSGDGYWYEIASITDDTNLVLVKNYQGTSIASGTAAYTIGEMSVIPEPYQDLLVYRPLALYFMADEPVLADRYWRLYDGGYEAGLSPVAGGLLKRAMDAYSGISEGIYMDELSPDELSLSDLAINPNRGYTGESW